MHTTPDNPIHADASVSAPDDTRTDLLTDFLHETDGAPTYAQVAEWCRRYPDHAPQITRLAAALAVTDATAPDPAALAPDPAFVARGVEVAMRLHRELAPPAPITQAAQAAPISGILAAAKERGHSAASFAAATRLSTVLVGKLDGRQITPDTVPERLIAQIAALVGRGTETVREYLAGKPQFAPAMQFRAAAPPTTGAMQSFAEAVQDDPFLDPDDRAHWQEAEETSPPSPLS